MSSILTYIDISDGKIKRSSLEILSYCTSLAENHGLKSEALIINNEPEKYVDKVQNYGASTIYTVKDPIFKNHLNVPVLKAISTVMERTNPRITAFGSTEGTKDILGALAANREAAALPDVSSFEIDGDTVKAVRPVMAAKILSEVTTDAETVLVSVRSGSYELTEKKAEGKVENIDFSFDDDELKITLREIITSSSEQMDLSEAETIVAAGRGAKDEEGQKLVNELASVLNAGTGASRALTEAGIMDPSLQIGQTGKVVSPQLYIAIGISGAIQHVAGMANSKIIVAINKDPDAAIFEIADYGLVGDLYKILPPFIEEIKKIKS